MPGLRFDADYHEVVTLRDGRRVELRLIRPTDKGTLRRGLEGLSALSRYQRFLSPKNTFTDEELRYLTEVDGLTHFALVAGVTGPDGVERGYGAGRFVRLTDPPDVAEAAVAVIDEAQHLGLGTVLLERLVEAARERGVQRFLCEILAENDAMAGILEKVVKGSVVVHRDAGVLHAMVSLGAQ